MVLTLYFLILIFKDPVILELFGSCCTNEIKPGEFDHLIAMSGIFSYNIVSGCCSFSMYLAALIFPYKSVKISFLK